MTMFIVLAVMGWATSALIVWRLCGASKQGIMRLRGGSYTRSGNPNWFWISVVLAIVGLLLCVGIALVSSSVLLGVIK
jgi:hypothetical protein